MPFVGTGHLWIIAIILVIVLIIWGPGKLPDVGSGLGRAIREFRKASSDTKDEFHKATRWDEPAGTAAPSNPAAAAAPAAAQEPAAAAAPAQAAPSAAQAPLPAAPAQAAPMAPILPAQAGGGAVPGAPAENDPR